MLYPLTILNLNLNLKYLISTKMVNISLVVYKYLSSNDSYLVIAIVGNYLT